MQLCTSGDGDNNGDGDGGDFLFKISNARPPKKFSIFNYYIFSIINVQREILQYLSNQISIAKDCLLTSQKQACSRITQLFVVVRHHAKNDLIHRKMVVDCPLEITSTVKRLSTPNQTRKKE